MRDSVYRINLDIHKVEAQVQLTAKRGDSARRIAVTLYEDGKPYVLPLDGCRAVLRIVKPNGVTLSSDCAIQADGEIVYSFSAATTEKTGLCACTMNIMDGDDVLYSPCFHLLVAENAALDGPDFYDTVKEAEAAEKKRAAAETARAAAETQRKTAETGRADAEAQRDAAETARIDAETARDSAESKRSAAEKQRNEQESARMETTADLQRIIAGLNLQLTEIGIDTSVSAESINAVTSHALYDAFRQVGVFTPVWAQGNIVPATGIDNTDPAFTNIRIRSNALSVLPGEELVPLYDNGIFLYVFEYGANGYIAPDGDLPPKTGGSGVPYKVGAATISVRFVAVKYSGDAISVIADGAKIFIVRSGALAGYTKSLLTEQTCALRIGTDVWKWKPGAIQNDGTVAITNTSICTDFVSPSESTVVRMRVPDGFTLTAYTRTGDADDYEYPSVNIPDGGYLLLSQPTAFKITPASGSILPEVGGNVRAETVDLTQKKETGHGVFTVQPVWGKNQYLSANSGFVRYSRYVHTYASQPIPISKAGIHVTYNPEFSYRKETDLPVFLFKIIKKTENGFVPAGSNDEDASELDKILYTINNRDIGLSESVYVPYVENSFLVLMLHDRAVETQSALDPYDYDIDLSDFSDLFLVYGGDVEDNGGRPLNMFPVRMGIKYEFEDPDTIDEETGNHKIWTNYILGKSKPVGFDISSYSSGNMYNGTRYYGIYVPLGVVRKIICSARHELLAEIWEITRDGHGYQRGVIFGREPNCQFNPNHVQYNSDTNQWEIVGVASPVTNKRVGKITGVHEIDLSKYDFPGYAIIAVRSSSELVRNGNTIAIKQNTMGFLRGYNSVKNNVFVEYAPNVVVTYRDGMPSRLAENIRVLSEDYIVPKYFSGHYTSCHSTYGGSVQGTFPEIYDVSPAFYAGGFNANSILQQITGKSYITAVQNPMSRVYQFARLFPWRNMSEDESIDASGIDPYDNSLSSVDWYSYQNSDALTDEQKDLISSLNNTSPGNIGYGLTCTNFLCVLFGLKENYPTHTLALQENLAKFDRVSGWDYLHDMEYLKPGDILAQLQVSKTAENNYAGHVILVNDVISINGSVTFIDTLEGYPPFARHRLFVDSDYYRFMDVPRDNSAYPQILDVGPMSGLSRYKYKLRIHPEEINRLFDVFDLNTNYSVGKVMCDRGTDSVYCLSAEHILLSVNDNDAETLVIENGSNSEEIDIADNSVKERGLRTVDIKDVVREMRSGLYQIRTKDSGGFLSLVQETFYVPLPADEYEYENTRKNGKVYIFIPHAVDDPLKNQEAVAFYSQVWYRYKIEEDSNEYCYGAIHLDPLADGKLLTSSQEDYVKNNIGTEKFASMSPWRVYTVPESRPNVEMEFYDTDTNTSLVKTYTGEYFSFRTIYDTGKYGMFIAGLIGGYYRQTSEVSPLA